MPPEVDVIVVGSGPGGAQAAHTLVDQGCTVVMIDVGLKPRDDEAQPPERSFVELRKTDATQHNYFLGPNCEGVPLRRLGAAPQVNPPRHYVFQIAGGHAPIETSGFSALESHALGGLGAAWGAVSFPYLDVELERSGLAPSEMRPSYERVARRIGISGARDDLTEVRGPLDTLQRPLDPDHNASALLLASERLQKRLKKQRLHVGRPMLAALSVDQDGRSAVSGNDMDFWSNDGGSVYRPQLTVRQLEQRPEFSYLG